MTLAARRFGLRTGVDLACVLTGPSSGPALVLVPGPTDSWGSYEEVIDHLPVSMRVVAVSPRGHGDSSAPAAGYAVRDFAGDVVALLDLLDIERAVLTGHSGSCLAVRRVAIDEGERVAGVVLEASPLVLAGDAGLETFVKDAVSGLVDPIDTSFVRSFVASTASDRIPSELIDRMAASASRVPARVWKETFAALLAYDDLAELDSIGAPALLLWGDADPLVSRDVQNELINRLGRAELRVYEGAGHTPRWEEPQRFAADVAAFADGVL